MNNEQYQAAKETHKIGSDIEARNAINFVLALIEAKKENITAAGSEHDKASETLKAVFAAEDVVTDLLHDAEEFSGKEET